MGRIVGSRSLQKLKDAFTICRVAQHVLSALREHAQYKILNQLEQAVQEFLICPLSQLELMAMSVVSEEILSPIFLFTKNSPGQADARMNQQRKANRARQQVKTEHKISQYDVILHVKKWKQILEDVEQSPEQLLNGSVAMKLGGQRCSWDKVTLKKKVFLSMLAWWDIKDRKAVLEVVLGAPNEKPNPEVWEDDWIGITRQLRAKDKPERKLHMQTLLRAAIPFVFKMFTARFASVLAHAAVPLHKRVPREVAVWKKMIAHADYAEQSFAQVDYYCTRSTSFKTSSMSTFTKANSNNPIKWLASLSLSDANFVLNAAMANAAVSEREGKERAVQVAKAKDEYLREKIAAGKESKANKERKFKEAADMIKNVALHSPATLATALRGLGTKAGKLALVKHQLEIWKARSVELKRGILKRGYLSEGGKPKDLTQLQQLIEQCCKVDPSIIGTKGANDDEKRQHLQSLVAAQLSQRSEHFFTRATKMLEYTGPLSEYVNNAAIKVINFGKWAPTRSVFLRKKIRAIKVQAQVRMHQTQKEYKKAKAASKAHAGNTQKAKATVAAPAAPKARGKAVTVPAPVQRAEGKRVCNRPKHLDE